MSASPGLVAVVTTIQPPTPAVRELHRRLAESGGRLVVAGDQKGPAEFDLPNCDFLSLADQQASGFALAEHLPDGPLRPQEHRLSPRHPRRRDLPL
jgi:hypothetical protein